MNETTISSLAHDWTRVHVCNYASRYKPSCCAREVRDGQRYCWQHRPRQQEKKDV